MYLLKPIRSNRYTYLFNTPLIVLIGYINYSENRQLSEGASLHELYFSLGISPTSTCSDYRKKKQGADRRSDFSQIDTETRSHHFLHLLRKIIANASSSKLCSVALSRTY